MQLTLIKLANFAYYKIIQNVHFVLSIVYVVLISDWSKYLLSTYLVCMYLNVYEINWCKIWLSSPIFLVCRNGVQQRRNSWQDGVSGTNCPIRPGKNFTYVLQVKDQIGSFYYFPSLLFHKAAGGYGAIRIWSRPKIPVPFPSPAGDFTVLAGDWFKRNHYVRILFLHLL